MAYYNNNHCDEAYNLDRDDMLDAIRRYTSTPGAMPLDVDEASIAYDDDAGCWTASARNADGATYLMELDGTSILLTLDSADSLPRYNQADFERFVDNRDTPGAAVLPSGDYTAVQFGGEFALHIGDGSVIGDGQHIGSMSRFGDGCTFGNGCTLGFGGEIGANAVIGDDFSVDDGCQIGDHAVIGARFCAGDELYIGDNCRIGVDAVIGNLCTCGRCIIGDGARIGDDFCYDPRLNVPDDGNAYSVCLGNHCTVGRKADLGDSAKVGADYTAAERPPKKVVSQQDVIYAYRELGSINATAQALELSNHTVRRTLLDAGVPCTQYASNIRARLENNETPESIAADLGITAKTVRAYYAFQRGSYSIGEKTEAAKKIAAWRARKAKEKSGHPAG